MNDSIKGCFHETVEGDKVLFAQTDTCMIKGKYKRCVDSNIENLEILNTREYRDTVANSFAEIIKYAAIVVPTVPVLCIYLMVQKHFTKEVMIRAVKG